MIIIAIQCFIISDILKINYFTRSEFSLIKFGAELCAEIAIKTYKILKKLCKIVQKYEKVPVLQVRRSKVKKIADSRKFCAATRPCVRAFQKLCIISLTSQMSKTSLYVSKIATRLFLCVNPISYIFIIYLKIHVIQRQYIVILHSLWI